MPHVLSPLISTDAPGMWFEGPAYSKKNIYSLEPGKQPPVNYDEHTLRPHSLTHLETPAHTQKNGNRLDFYYEKHVNFFFGKTLVLRLRGNNYQALGNNIFHWVISLKELKESLAEFSTKNFPEKILITTEFYQQNNDGYHDPNYVLTLSQEAADYLISHQEFHLFGTSWKSSDYNPGKAERPIHNTLFKNGVILENLQLKDVPQGFYFMSAFPIPLKDASESPVVPILYAHHEIHHHF